MTTKILSLICLLAMAFVFVHCGSDDPDPEPPIELTPEEEVKALLTNDGTAATWSPPSATSGVLVDGIDVTEELFPGFSLTFNQNGTLTTTGTTPVWLRSDTWVFVAGKEGREFTRGQDDKVVKITDISASELKLTLEWDTTTYGPGGRQHSLKGTYEFTLKK
jgi:hypothetical protein